MIILERLMNWYRVRKHNVKLGSNVQLNGACLFTTAAGGEIRIGNNVTINSGEKYNRIGGDTRTIIQTIGQGKINIGSNVGISNCAMICRDSISIEDNVFVGGGTKLYDNDFHSLDYKIRISAEDQNNIKARPIRICKGAFIGAHCIILKGVTVGRHSIIGAGSVVTKDVPDNEIWAGNPAKFIRAISENG